MSIVAISYYVALAFGILLASLLLVQLADRWVTWREARALRVIPGSSCPKCGVILGREATANKVHRQIKFVTGSGKKRRGREYPTNLLALKCPHCGAVLEYRLDATLFACDKTVYASS